MLTSAKFTFFSGFGMPPSIGRLTLSITSSSSSRSLNELKSFPLGVGKKQQACRLMIYIMLVRKKKID